MKKTFIHLCALVIAVVVAGCQTVRPNVSPTPAASKPETGRPAQQEPAVNAGITIMLSGKGLKTIPRDTFDRTGATVLDVSNNALTGALPAEVRLLKDLVELNASNNAMTGIPAEIGQLTKLQVLIYASNSIDTMPNEIQNLRSLRYLSLANNQYRTIPDSVTSLTNLITLDVTGNPLQAGEIERVRARMTTTKVLF